MALLTLVLLTLALLTLGPASYGSTNSGLGRPTAPYVLRHFLLRLPSLWCSFLWPYDLLTMASAYSSPHLLQALEARGRLLGEAHLETMNSR